MTPRKKAFALALLLGFLPVLIMLVGAFLSITYNQNLQSRLVYDQTQALYLAETAIVDAISELEVDPSWNAGFQNKRVPGVDGSYSIRFNTSGAPYSKDESVNNLDGTQPDNYRGPGFVPTGTVSLVARAQVGPHVREVEALVRLGGGLFPVDMGMLTTGNISLSGNVTVDGVAGAADPTPVNASIHSNQGGAGTDLISWDGTGTASITGKVSVVGSTAGAINLPGATIGQGQQLGASARPVPRVNIQAKISARSGSPTAVISGSGSTTLNNGDFYRNSSTTVAGDLVLNGTRLYVNGDLTVNGAIKGNGSLYVSGQTRLQGDTRISSSSPDKVAIFSRGSVVLSGFDGTAYMDTLAASNPSLASHWSATKTALADLQAELAVPSPVLGSGSQLDLIKAELGGYMGATPSVARPGHNIDNPGALLADLSALPNTPAKAGIVAKLTELRDVFEAQLNGSPEEIAAAAAMAQNRVIRGAIDGVIDQSATAALPMATAYVNSIDYNRLGSSSFQGLVYTQGAFVAQNEVDVRGAVVVDDDGSQPPLTLGAKTYKAGSLNLLNGTRLTYVQDFFQSNGQGSGPQGVKVILWMGR